MQSSLSARYVSCREAQIKGTDLVRRETEVDQSRLEGRETRDDLHRHGHRVGKSIREMESERSAKTSAYTILKMKY